jgi:hypothetical protein
MQYRYRGLCGQFGKTKTLVAALLVPAIVNAAILQSENIAVIGLTSLCASFMGAVGFMAGMEVHRACNNLFKKENIDKATGNRLTLAAQMVIYAVPFTMSAYLSVIANHHFQATQQLPHERHQLIVPR